MVDANEEGGVLAVRGEKAFAGGGGDEGIAGEYGPEALGVVDRLGFQVLGEGARGKVGKIRHEERLSEPKVAFREGGVRNSGLEVVGMMGKEIVREGVNEGCPVSPVLRYIRCPISSPGRERSFRIWNPRIGAMSSGRNQARWRCSKSCRGSPAGSFPFLICRRKARWSLRATPKL